MHPLVSVIIPTKNSHKTLEDCLLSLKAQDYPNLETIVVDNFSTDGTWQVAKTYADRTFQKGPERTEQKNYGIAQSEGEYVCFIDSDMIVTAGVIAECVDVLGSHQEIGGVCIPERSVGNGMFVRIRDFERSFYSGTSMESARFFRKSDVEKVGGFEEDLIFFEESLLPQKIEKILKLGCNISINAYIHHQEGDLNLVKWLAKKFYYGKSLGDYRTKVREIGIKTTQAGQTGIIGRYMIFLGNKRFYRHPLLALGVLGLKTLEFASGGMGFLLDNMKKKME